MHGALSLTFDRKVSPLLSNVKESQRNLILMRAERAEDLLFPGATKQVLRPLPRPSG